MKKEYDGIVKEYCENAHLKGFRKGKVPADVVIRKLGPALIDQTRSEVLEKSLTEVFESVEKKPLPYATPEIKSEDALELGKDFAFEVIYDTWPAIELGPYIGVEVDQPAWEITDEDLGRELKGIQEQNALFTDKDEGVVEKGNIVNIDYVELDEAGADKPGTKREAFVFEVGTGYNVYKVDDEVIGMKKGDTKMITKTFPEDFETKALAGKTVMLRVVLNSIKEKKLPEVNDELAQDISEKFQTLDDLKKDIRKKLEDAVKSAVRSRTVTRVLDSVVETSKIPLPQSMVDYQLEAMWQEYANQLRIEEKQARGPPRAAGEVHRGRPQGVDPRGGEAGAAAAGRLRDRQEGGHRHRGQRPGRGDRQDGGGAQGRPGRAEGEPREERPRGLHEEQPPHGQAVRLPALQDDHSHGRKREKYWTSSRGIRYH